MKRMIPILVPVLVMFAAAGCRATNSHSSADTTHVTGRTSEKSRFEQLYFELRDSLVNIKAPQERSETRGLQHSFLRTSLASSTAGIDSAGLLYHSIENRDSIPSKIVYRNVRHTVRDTVRIHTADTLRIKESEYVERSLTFVQRAQIRGFWALLAAALIAGAWYYVKRKLRR